MSGGQLQRIGIARALYQNPSLLVLDEATSSLDLENEKYILKNIMNNNEMTIIMVTHRVNNLSYCNKVYKFNKNKLETI